MIHAPRPPAPEGEAALRAAEQIDQARRAWLADKKQELLSPAAALLELSGQLIDDAAAEPALLADLVRVRDAARRTQAMLRGVMDPVNAAGLAEQARKLRHDMRTPLAEIIGLCEDWVEDGVGLSAGLLEDLGALCRLSRGLLASQDELLQFGKIASDPEIDLSGDRADQVRGVVTSMRPASAAPRCHGAILVVEDNAVNRDVLARRLRREGHCVSTAEDGRAALQAVRRQAFDLVLLDVIMPEVHGLEVLRQMKADAALRDVPVIMISAFDDVESVASCIEMGAEDYLPKPIAPLLLKARVDASLEKKRLRDREVRYREQIEQERRRADELLHVILPAQIVRELKATNQVRPRRFEGVAVLFADVVGFTPFCDRSQPEEMMPPLQALNEAWEEIAARHGVQKIKTIGDALMAAAGLLEPADNPVANCLRCGLEMIEACRAMPVGWDLRVGIHVGPVVAGVIGRRQYLFDLWGDTVNTAARMESHGVPGAVTLSAAAWGHVAALCRGESRGPVKVKGKGDLEMVKFESFV